MAVGADAQLHEVVTRVVPAEKQERVLSLERRALRMALGETVDHCKRGSRFGGRPLGVAGASWPTSEGRPLDLLAQFDLAEIAAVRPDGPLPDDGLLSFFYDTEDPSWTYEAPVPEKWRVCWERGAVQPLPPPEGWETFPARGIRWEPVTTLPRPTEDDCVFQDCGLLRELSAVDHAVGGGPVFHQLMGWPHLLQGSMTTTCQRESAFVWDDLDRFAPDRDLSAEDWDVLDDAVKASDWRLLLQLGSDFDGDWCWGNGGGLYFWIRADDLAAARFDRVWTVMQC